MIQRYSLDYLRQRKYEASAEGGDYIDEPVCLESDVAQLEAENAALKAQHAEDEKALQVLADLLTHNCYICPFQGKLGNCHKPECVLQVIAYAKQEAAKK
jgi:hypothetical protein